jgi:hypothetical protein
MSPAKAIVTGCGGDVVELVAIELDVVAEVGGADATTGESSDRNEQQARSSAAATAPVTVRPLTRPRYRFVLERLADYNLRKLLSGQCCLESAWTESIRRPNGNDAYA